MREQYRAGNLEDRSVMVDLPVRKGAQQIDHNFQQARISSLHSEIQEYQD